jgi:hypothetical protein
VYVSKNIIRTIRICSSFGRQQTYERSLQEPGKPSNVTAVVPKILNPNRRWYQFWSQIIKEKQRGSGKYSPIIVSNIEYLWFTGEAAWRSGPQLVVGGQERSRAPKMGVKYSGAILRPLKTFDSTILERLEQSPAKFRSNFTVWKWPKMSFIMPQKQLFSTESIMTGWLGRLYLAPGGLILALGGLTSKAPLSSP